VLGREDGKDIRLRSAIERPPGADPGSESPLLTMDGDVVGTPSYMAPEQARGDVAAMGPHSDVYAVGAMLYHLLAGHMPYVALGEKPSSRAVWERLKAGPPQPLREAAPQAPPELAALCEKAMSRDADRRYADMSALSADLTAYLEGRVVRAYETGAWAEARKWVRRNRALAASLAAAVLAVAVGAVAFAIKATESSERARDVLRLSALQDLEDLVAEADALWPPHPAMIDRYRAWIEEAEEQVAELPGYRSQRAELRATALPWSAEQERQDRETHPDFPRLAALRAELGAKRAALLQRRDGVPVELPELDWSRQPRRAADLHGWAARLVRPGREVFGREAEGLALVQRALEEEGTDLERANRLATLSWAFLALGRDDEALAARAAAEEAAPEALRERFARGHADMKERILEAESEDGLRRAAEEIAELEREVAQLELRVGARRDWRFPESRSEARWWNEQLAELIGGLEALADEQRGLLAAEGVSSAHGWSVPRRLVFARELEQGFAEGGRWAEAWSEALPAIRDTYPGIDLEPQMGLLPIGANPASGLWEFAHLMSGAPARRGQDGALEMTGETGVVLVLLPGGTFVMGAQKEDPAGPNYDPHARDWEAPPHEVELSPFFLSKYELTRGQWLRLTGANPVEGLNVVQELDRPVAMITWEQCRDGLARAGLEMPSEAQWEYGARAGTSTPWFTGPERGSVAARCAANTADESAARKGLDQTDIEYDPDPEDGFPVYAPVGSFAANAFGLHDVIGNVSEHCRDRFAYLFYARGPRLDPVAPFEGEVRVFFRGGSWAENALRARSSYRRDSLPDAPSSQVGVRPARGLER